MPIENNENRLTAAHEIGHYLIGRRYGLKISNVSIERGEEHNAGLSFDKISKPDRTRMVMVYMAGWAGEALVRSHSDQCKEFDQASYVQQLWPARVGTGWPLALFLGGRTDCGLAAKGLHRFSLLFPRRALIALGREIFDERQMFFHLMFRLEKEKTLIGAVLDALYNGAEWSVELQKNNVNGHFDLNAEKFFRREDKENS